MLMHSIGLISMMFVLCAFIYVTASMPNILESLHIMTWDEITLNMNELYYAYFAYFKFSFLHFIILISSIVFVVIGGYSLILHRYKNQSIVMWMRGD